MDPNAALRDQEELLQEMSEYEQDGTTFHPAYLLARDDLRASQSALRSWLNSGGFAPAWEKHQSAATDFQRKGWAL